MPKLSRTLKTDNVIKKGAITHAGSDLVYACIGKISSQGNIVRTYEDAMALKDA